MLRQVATAVVVSLCFFAPQARSMCDYFDYGLDPTQVVPAAKDVLGHGWSELSLCDDDSLRGYVWTNVPETVTEVHIHGPAQLDQNGPLLFKLPLPAFQFVHFSVVTDSQSRDLLLGQSCYVDLHTIAHPDGAIRGWIHHEVAVEAVDWSDMKQVYR